ncbi:MAG: tetratricopeptide repeat protein [Bacteroidota bacterium]
MKLLIALFFLFSCSYNAYACSVYKITLHGKTFVGNNEDYWNPNTRMWFERGQNGNYGGMYVGLDNFYPQGGMNEKGLVFDGFSVTSRAMKSNPNKLSPQNNILQYIMQKCQNIDDVYKIVEKYDLSNMLISSMWIFIDAEGNYLVVEGDTVTKGNDSTYVLSNFCPSQTPDLDKVDIPSYQNARKLLEAKSDTTLSFLTALSDTLHQSFPQDLGGTQYTTIYDLKEKVIHLYYHHDYSKSITINLTDELQKTDTVLNIPELFPNNVSGKENFRKINKAKDFLKELANPEFSVSYSKIKDAIKAKDLSILMRLFESEINTIGYDLLNGKDKTPAINVFTLNVEYFPTSWNAYDSLGDAYFEDKNYAVALLNYRKSLELNPNNQNAIKQIKQLTK